MKLRSLTQSAGERAVKAILEDRLVRTPFQVWGKVRLNAAMGKEDGEHLPDELFRLPEKRRTRLRDHPQSSASSPISRGRVRRRASRIRAESAAQRYPRESALPKEWTTDLACSFR